MTTMKDGQANHQEPEQLKTALLPRHVTMLSLGGTIGAGLFLGIAEPLSTVGPLGTMLAYLAAGLIMLCTMLCLGELSTTFPNAGSFQYYLYKFFKNPVWSFTIGWLYWLSWVFSLAAGLVAAGMISNDLLPFVSVWGWCLFYLCLLTAFNMTSVSAFGECEYWLAGIKVVAIILFIICGCYLIYSRMSTTDWQPTLYVNDLLFPAGAFSIFQCMAVVIYSFQGAELVGNVASETPHPEKILPRIIRGIGVRIILFYVLSVGILAVLNPHGYIASDSGPFVTVFSELGIPGTETLMKLVILSAALSAANSGIYASSRMFWSMANERMAPSCFQRLNKNQVPMRAIALCSALSLVCLFTKDYSPQRLFIFLISSTAQVGCLAWFVIAACQLKYRWSVNRGIYPENPKTYKTPLTPWTAIIVMIANFIIIVGGWFSQDGLLMFAAEAVLTILILIGYFGIYKKRNPIADPQGE